MNNLRRFKAVKSLSKQLTQLRKRSAIIGFVPTMGALHSGHLSLIKKSIITTDITLASIFVNPIQFNDPSDLQKYPRNLKTDRALLEKSGCHLLFTPSIKEIYPRGAGSIPAVDLEGLDQPMEGNFRPGHFAGVAKVMLRLLGIVQPGKLFMGQKDFQQTVIVDKILKLFNMETELVICPTLREKSGLALSSRNSRLDVEIRKQACIIYHTLQFVKLNFNKYPVNNLEIEAIRRMSIPDFKVEYFSIVDGHTLQEVNDSKQNSFVVACAAVWAGGVRLIDNIIIRNE